MIFFILLKYFPLFLQQIIYFWLLGVFAAGRGLSLVEAGRGHSSCSVQASHCSGFSCCGA